MSGCLCTCSIQYVTGVQARNRTVHGITTNISHFLSVELEVCGGWLAACLGVTHVPVVVESSVRVPVAAVKRPEPPDVDWQMLVEDACRKVTASSSHGHTQSGALQSARLVAVAIFIL